MVVYCENNPEPKRAICILAAGVAIVPEAEVEAVVAGCDVVLSSPKKVSSSLEDLFFSPAGPSSSDNSSDSLCYPRGFYAGGSARLVELEMYSLISDSATSYLLLKISS